MTAFLDPDWIRALDPFKFWLYALGAWAACLGAFYFGWRYQRRLRLILDTPKSLIRSAAQGYVEMQGDARLMPGEPILAPLTRLPCVWWSYCIEEHRGSGKSSHWATIQKDVSGHLFLLDDGTGQCVVDPDQADVYPSVHKVWYGDEEYPEGGPEMASFGLGRRYRYTERRMHERDTLYVLGYFHTQGPSSSADIDAEVLQQLRAWKRDQPWLLSHFDADRDGQIDPQEWEAARAEARRLVLEQEREAMQRPPVNVLSRAPDGRDYILSTLPQKNLEWRLRLYSLACLLAFLGGGALGTYLINVRLR